MTLLDRLAEPPSRVVGIALAALAAVLLIGGELVPGVIMPFELDADGNLLWSEAEIQAYTQLYLGVYAVGLLGLLPLLSATHTLLRRTAVPAGLLLGAYALLLVRPIALMIDALAAPAAPIAGLGPVAPYLLLATTGIAAGLASVAILPLARDAASPARRWTLAAAIAALVALALFAFAPYIAPVSALGVAAALVLRRGDAPNGVSRAGMNGPAGQS